MVNNTYSNLYSEAGLEDFLSNFASFNGLCLLFKSWFTSLASSGEEREWRSKTDDTICLCAGVSSTLWLGPRWCRKLEVTSFLKAKTSIDLLVFCNKDTAISDCKKLLLVELDLAKLTRVLIWEATWIHWSFSRHVVGDRRCVQTGTRAGEARARLADSRHVTVVLHVSGQAARYRDR